MKDFKAFYRKYAKLEGVVVHRGCPEKKIAFTERVLNRKLPQSYRVMISMFGWMQVHGDVVYGLGPDVSDAESVLEVAVFESVCAEPQMLNHLIPIVAVGNGDHYCLDASKVSGGDAPVVLWRHDHPRGILQRPIKQSASLLTWLEKLQRREID